jgi:acyl-[acyl-carrier-protein]-phospholipid O-acyltransferase/long-chain-fatty-acid--[acyl-carrier-protein] ligase
MGLWADQFLWVGVGLGVPLIGIVLLGLLWPYGLLRFVLALLTRSLFWLRVKGSEHIPARGGALLVCNPVGYLGWLLVLAASPRKVRFIILAGWTGRPGVRQLLRWTGAITVEPSATRADLDNALQRAAEGLGQGDLVCLCTEGCQTRDGARLTFQSAFDAITGRQPVPILPVCLQQLRGSLVYLVSGRVLRRWPHEIPSPVEVGFALPLPAGTPAAQARQALQQLSADTAIARAARRRPVHRQFVRMAAHRPFRSCVIDSSAPGRDLTYARAFVAVYCLSRILRPVVGESPMVAIWLPPSTGCALANLALAFLGKTSVNLNYTAASESIQSALRRCDCRHVLSSRRFTARIPLDPGPDVEIIYLEDFLPRIPRMDRLRGLLAVLLLPGWLLERVLGLTRHGVDDLATVIFSSGSTGEPKGVMLTHGNVAANAESMIQATGLGPHDRALAVLPFFHSFGYTVALWAPLQVGASAVYHPDPRQSREIGELSRTHRCTIYLSTATFLRFCLKKCEPDDFRTIRILMCGAEKLPPSLAEEFLERFGVRPLEGYGCTELAPAAAANMPDVEFNGLVTVHNRQGTVGPPLPGVAARVVHPETHETLPIGEEGMLLVTGANVMKGYLDRPDLTQQAIRDGWYVTGDMARLDADGYVTLTGRLSRFAKVGGEMVPLEKIEEELHDILGTADRVCAVTCVPDESRGERLIVLYVAAHLGPFGLEVRAWCQQLNCRGLPNLWLPSERDFISVPELPVLGSGKINLKGIKEMALTLAVRTRVSASGTG